MTNIRELCNEVSFNRIYNWNNIPGKMLKNVIKELGIEEDSLVLFYDSSIFETGKNGLAICDNGIYTNDISTPPAFLDWDEFLKATITNEEYYIYLNGKNNFFVYHRDLELVIDMLKSLQEDIEKKIDAKVLIKG